VDGLSETSHRTREVSQTCCGHHFTPTRGLYLGEDRRWGFLNPTVRALSNCKPTLPSPSVTDSHSTAPDIVSHQLRAMILLCITRLAHSVSTKFSGRSQAMIVDVTLMLCTYGPIQPSGMDHPPYGAKRRGCPFSPAALRSLWDLWLQMIP